MSHVVPLAEARETTLFGSKAVGLGEALRAGLPVPDGIALSGAAVEAVATDEASMIEEVATSGRAARGPVADHQSSSRANPVW